MPQLSDELHEEEQEEGLRVKSFVWGSALRTLRAKLHRP